MKYKYVAGKYMDFMTTNSGHAVAATRPYEPSQQVTPIEERILMIDYTPARAWSEGWVTTPRSRGALAEATMAKAMSFPPPPTGDEVDRLYHQLAEIHAIGAAQLAECARWRCSASTSSPVRARTDL
jgi:hypothetical protein